MKSCKKDTHTSFRASVLVSVSVLVIQYLEKQYNGKRTYSAHNLGYNASILEKLRVGFLSV